MLNGIAAAKRYHQVHSVETNIEPAGGRINIFQAIINEGAPLLFRPLQGLLGAYILDEEQNRGILISTQRRLPIQRFTGAHELGHLLLGHSPSLDNQETLDGRFRSLPSQEIEANAFAEEFLSPRWLLKFHAIRQGWTNSDLINPTVTYQLSLRLGQSYEATCRTLQSKGLISNNDTAGLLEVSPKSIKQGLLPKQAYPEQWYGDVWQITEKDHGLLLEGDPDDLFVFRLHEKSSAGYVWDLDQVRKEGFTVITEDRTYQNDGLVGSGLNLSFVTTNSEVPKCTLSLEHKRPWRTENPSISELILNFQLYGKEKGLPRIQRPNLVA